MKFSKDFEKQQRINVANKKINKLQEVYYDSDKKFFQLIKTPNDILRFQDLVRKNPDFNIDTLKSMAIQTSNHDPRLFISEREIYSKGFQVTPHQTPIYLIKNKQTKLFQRETPNGTKSVTIENATQKELREIKQHNLQTFTRNSQRLERFFDLEQTTMSQYHGSPSKFDNFKLNGQSNGRSLGAGVYLTPTKEMAEGYSKGKYLYEVEVSKKMFDDSRKISINTVTLDKDTVTNLIIGVSQKQIEDEGYPYFISDYEEPTSETSMDQGNKNICKNVAENIMDSSKSDIDIINEVINGVGGDQGIESVTTELAKQNIYYAVREDSNKTNNREEYIVFDPKQTIISKRIDLENHKEEYLNIDKQISQFIKVNNNAPIKGEEEQLTNELATYNIMKDYGLNTQKIEQKISSHLENNKIMDSPQMLNKIISNANTQFKHTIHTIKETNFSPPKTNKRTITKNREGGTIERD